MAASVKANRINVSKIVYAVITKDDSTGFNYDAIKKLGEPMQVQLTPTLATGVLYGAGVKQEDTSKITGYELQLEVNKVPIENAAEILGHTYANGVCSVKGTDQPADIAVGWEVDQTGGYKEYVWLYKGNARPAARTTQQSTENFTYSTDSLTIGFVPRDYDGKIMDFADTANSAFTVEAASTYLTTIPGGTLNTEG